MDYKDYYKIMGLEKTATAADIKQAYRKLARKYHPDVSKEADAENKFKEVGEAYEVLKDPQKRAQYDKFGQHWQAQSQEGSSAGQQRHYQSTEGFDGADFEEFISSIFKQRARQQQQPYYDQGEDIHAKLQINLEDSFHGLEKTIQLQLPTVDQQGRMSHALKAIKVKIPKGITNKQQIRLKGQGSQGAAQKPGDLYIEITINPHALFHLHNKDIYLELPLSPWEAALGADIKVPTLAGPVNLKIPKSSQSGKQMRLKGRGLPGNPAGDQYLKLKIVNPEHSTAEQDALYEQLAKISDFNPRANLGAGHE